MSKLNDKELNFKCREVARTCLAGNLRRLARALSKVYDEALRPSGLRGTQFNLMTAIILMEPVSISKLAQVLAMDRTTLTRNLGPLQKEELVDISPGEDQRVRMVAVTEAGNRMYQQAFPLWFSVQGDIENKLGKQLVKSILSDAKAAAKMIG